MSGELIDHVGILVPNIEEAIEKWSQVMGYHFSPIMRYSTTVWCDSSNPEPHVHHPRFSNSMEGPPYIELMEVIDCGTHGPNEIGVHHFGILANDLTASIDNCTKLGVRINGHSTKGDLVFTEKLDLDGIRLELLNVFEAEKNLVKDDFSKPYVDPVTGRVDFWGPRERRG